MREIVLDTETTGLDPKSGHKIIEIGCIELVNKIRTGESFHVFVNPKRDVPKEAFNIHGISTEFLEDKQEFVEVADKFVEFVSDSPLVIHNARFDMKFINYELKEIGKKMLTMDTVIDTLDMARRKFPGSPASLDALCKRFGVDLSRRDKHGALLDAELLAEVYLELTGGSQTRIRFEEENKNSKKTELVFEKASIEHREFPVSSGEKKAHTEMLKKIKSPAWEE